MLSGYLVIAAGLLVFMGRRGHLGGSGARGAGPRAIPAPSLPISPSAKFRSWLLADGPRFFLQFCFGSLFSALFILYFLSSSYLPGFLVAAGLLGLLVANEFLEDHYHRFTLTWAMFGTCAILFLNFAIPHLMGSIEARWFYLSTAAGV